MTLDDVRADAFQRLSDGAARPRSPFRNPALATVDAHGLPNVRTVVLRGFDPATRALTAHSDVRAPKIGELGDEPRVMLHAWDARDQVQLRILARASLRLGEAAKADWGRLHPGSRTTYAVALTPGMPLGGPALADQRRLPESEAFLNFAVIEAVMDSLDWLCLARTGNRRARFTWVGGDEHATWLVP